MAQGPLGSLLEDIRRLYEDGAIGCQSDAQLLERFRSLGDRAAFEALVGRHGRMVLAVCREVLGDPDDAEDAFQATFLLLARKAGSLRVGRTLAGWLHRVGYRVAIQAGIAAGRRRRHEGRAAALAAHAVERPADAIAEAAEGRRLLHAELDRLPDRLRIPVVLYYLEGRSYAEAALQLGVTETTVRGRLARARDRLRDRLGPPLVSSVSAVPPGLIALTARAASCVTLAPASATASAIVLMREVLGAMIVSKLKVAAAGIAAVCALAWMTASLAAPAAQDEPRPPVSVQALPSTAMPAAGAVVHYAGRVLGPADRPIEGAAISLCYTIGGKGKLVELGRRGADRGNTRLTTERAPFFLKRTLTDAAGRFEFDVDRSHLVKNGADDALRDVYLYATSKGYGPVRLAAGYPPESAPAKPRQLLDHLEFRLPRDDVPIEGRILDERGHPAVGARVTPLSMYYKRGSRGEPLDWSDRGLLRPLEERIGSIGREDLMVLTPSVAADAEGRFRLTGLGRERAVVLEISLPGSGSERVEVITHAARSEPVTYPESLVDGRPVIRYNGAEFVHRILGPESRIRTVFIYVRPRGDRTTALRVTEWLTTEISRSTKLKVIGNPDDADLILEATINTSRKPLPD